MDILFKLTKTYGNDLLARMIICESATFSYTLGALRYYQHANNYCITLLIPIEVPDPDEFSDPIRYKIIFNKRFPSELSTEEVITHADTLLDELIENMAFRFNPFSADLEIIKSSAQEQGFSVEITF